MGNIFILLLFIHLESFPSFGDDSCKKEDYCRIGRTHRMKSVDCFDRNLKFFPKCLPTDCEVLDLSYNRIRKIHRSDLSQFTSVKLLYLNENFFDSLPNDTFEDLENLVALDLSQNNLKRVPPSIFKLPSLNILNLRQNLELNMASSLEAAKPVTSPLMVIDMSCITDEYSVVEFPDFGTMPHLTSLNISENKFQVLTPKHFAGLCSLKLLNNVKVSNNYEDDCDCMLINQWLSERKVEFQKFRCSASESECRNKKLSEEDQASYHDCLEEVRNLEKVQRLKKIGIGVGVAALVIIIALCVIGYYYYKGKRNRKISSKNTNTQVKSQGPLLLNNHPKLSDGTM